MPETMTADVAIHGECTPQFEPLRRAFESNFRDRNELGASLAVYLEGEKVVDLWGGYMDQEKTRPWQEDTIVGMASVVKGMLAFALHMLADRGKIDYDAPVARYWPEFAQGGKGEVTVRQAISHHAAIPFIDHAEPGDAFRFDKIVAAIAKQAPEWEPGTRGAYHTVSIIYILEKLIQEASGRPAWDFFRDEITNGLGVDYHIRMTGAELARFGQDFDTEHFIAGAGFSPEVLQRFLGAFGNPATDLTPEELAGLPLLMAGGNARGVARLFSAPAMGGVLDGKQVLSPRTIDLMTQAQWYEPCAVWGTPMKTALGFLINDPEFFYIGPNPRAFGTAGGGGSFGFADRENHMSVAYSLNRWWPALALGDRARVLVDAAYECIPVKL